MKVLVIAYFYTKTSHTTVVFIKPSMKEAEQFIKQYNKFHIIVPRDGAYKLYYKDALKLLEQLYPDYAENGT